MFNVKRTYPAPASLALRKSYSDEDVIKELQKIFHNKCYLCESKSLTHLNVEHFKPHKGINLALKFDWNNLFYVCGRCNNIKRARYTNILDCTEDQTDVLRAIKHLPPTSAYGKITIKAMIDSDEAKITAQLLDEIFNGNETGNKKVASKELRKNVFTALYRFNELHLQYIDDETPERQKAEVLEKLQTLANNKQQFSAFIRWTIFGDEELVDLLQKHID